MKAKSDLGRVYEKKGCEGEGEGISVSGEVIFPGPLRGRHDLAQKKKKPKKKTGIQSTRVLRKKGSRKRLPREKK